PERRVSRGPLVAGPAPLHAYLVPRAGFTRRRGPAMRPRAGAAAPHHAGTTAPPPPVARACRSPLWNAASSQKTLQIMLVIAAVGMPFVPAYTTAIYWTSAARWSW